MDLTGSFFSKLRALGTTLERQAEQLKQAFRADETEFEDDSPMRYLHELYSEIRTLKGEADSVLIKKSEERDATYDFIKASKVLMNRNAADLGKIRDIFEKYGYKPVIREAATKDEAETDPEPAKSDQEELKNLACPEDSSRLDPLVRIPQLSDFGLSKYALPSTWNTVNILQQAHVQKEQPREDYSGCPSPKIEQFCIKGRDLCVDNDTVYLTEDQTIFLLNNAKKSRQANKMNKPSVVPASKENLATPGQKSKVCDYDYMASPAAPTFCTPGLKVPSRKNTTLPKSPESNLSDASNNTDEVTHPDPPSLEKEPEPPYVTQMVPNNGYVEEAVVPVLPSNKYLDCLKTPAPPAISDYRNIFTTTPPAPEITVIPTQILQILSKYSSNTDPPRVTEKVKNEGMATQFERRPALALDISNKENREDERKETKQVYKTSVDGRVGRGRPQRMYLNQIEDIFSKVSIVDNTEPKFLPGLSHSRMLFTLDSSRNGIENYVAKDKNFCINDWPQVEQNTLSSNLVVVSQKTSQHLYTL